MCGCCRRKSEDCKSCGAEVARITNPRERVAWQHRHLPFAGLQILRCGCRRITNPAVRVTNPAVRDAVKSTFPQRTLLTGVTCVKWPGFVVLLQTSMCKILRSHKFSIIFSVFLSIVECKGQAFFYNDEVVQWSSFRNPEIPDDFSMYSNNDLIIVDDKTEFKFFKNGRYLSRLLTIKINNSSGLSSITHFRLPESFDIAFDANLRKQGRGARLTTPFIDDYQVKKFSARKQSGTGWTQLKFNNNYEQVKWTRGSGQFLVEDLAVFKVQDLKAGDVIQIYYEAAFSGSYGGGIFYFYGKYPKIMVEYNFIYEIEKYYAGHMFVGPVNIPDSLITSQCEIKGNNIVSTHRMVFRNVSGINYPANAFEGGSLPHVYVEMGFLRVLKESYPDEVGRVNTYDFIKPKKFEWLHIYDTNYYYTKIYDKHFAGIRKFVSSFPPLNPDSSNIEFCKAFCDTLNSFRYITMNQLYYNESNLYEVSSTDHLLRRRLVGSADNLCRDILSDNHIFYYRANIEDHRFGEHSAMYRMHFAYEWALFAIPYRKSYLYFLPRLFGVAYNVNELPFYLEGSLAALLPKNIQPGDTSKSSKFCRFIKTHKGTYNENTRTENATLKIDIDKKEAEYSGKESLSGQFSTVLRHLYLGELIDSTISPHYFRRCTEKPGASDVKIKLSSKITNFPFRYTFKCTEKIKLGEPDKISFSNWFSFVLNSNSLPEKPTHQYFFDFDFTDVYNLLLQFSRPVTLTNMDTFRKKVNNEYFEIDSEILKQSESAFLVKVSIKVKQMSIPLVHMQLLMDLVKELEELNDFSLYLAN
jgi:hypothetical protein